MRIKVTKKKLKFVKITVCYLMKNYSNRFGLKPTGPPPSRFCPLATNQTIEHFILCVWSWMCESEACGSGSPQSSVATANKIGKNT